MLSKNQIKLIKSLETKKNRKREGLFVAEGPKVVGDLLRAGYTPHSIFSTVSRPDAELITDDELRRISFLQHPQEVLGVFHIPTPSQTSDIIHQTSTLSLALDGVQDPGNVGTIIRIADWFGITQIYCSPDTADVYNPKVVQAPPSYPVYGTLLDGENIYKQELTNEGIIVMGNEGNGISTEVRQLVTNKLLIPNFNKNSETAESLNVAIATAITLSEFRRLQRHTLA